jgi:hypothetical protein
MSLLRQPAKDELQIRTQNSGPYQLPAEEQKMVISRPGNANVKTRAEGKQNNQRE